MKTQNLSKSVIWLFSFLTFLLCFSACRKEVIPEDVPKEDNVTYLSSKDWLDAANLKGDWASLLNIPLVDVNHYMKLSTFGSGGPTGNSFAFIEMVDFYQKKREEMLDLTLAFDGEKRTYKGDRSSVNERHKSENYDLFGKDLTINYRTEKFPENGEIRFKSIPILKVDDGSYELKRGARNIIKWNANDDQESVIIVGMLYYDKKNIEEGTNLVKDVTVNYDIIPDNGFYNLSDQLFEDIPNNSRVEFHIARVAVVEKKDAKFKAVMISYQSERKKVLTH